MYIYISHVYIMLCTANIQTHTHTYTMNTYIHNALQSYTGPKEDLGTAERFLFELLCIPRLKPRLQCFVFILEFNARLHDLSENVEVRMRV